MIVIAERQANAVFMGAKILNRYLCKASFLKGSKADIRNHQSCMGKF